MNKNFEILKLDSKPYDFLIIATSYENPLSMLEEIEKEIKKPKADLLFDLTLINGVSSNRYIKCSYEAGQNSCSIVDRIDDKIKKISYDFFAANEDIVQESVIPNSLKYLLKAEMV